MENMLKTNLRLKVSLKKDVLQLDILKINDKLSYKTTVKNWELDVRY